MRTIRTAQFLVMTTVAALLSSTAVAQSGSTLGKVSFPTSGSATSREHFLRGVAALHSFWFEEALDEFRESTKSDPDFMMGYWGEAMALNHPLWSEQDTETARKVIEKIRDTPKLTVRERAYLNAVKALYGAGDKLARDKAYCSAMENIHHDYPDDLEAAAFYSLSLLGSVRPGDRGYRVQALAGAIAFDVYAKNPNHPGAAHYIIHAFDDPEHAVLALPAARRYAEIAPAAHHARHMPSHIFLQLGMWPEAAASNESAWATSDAWVKSKHLSLSLRDYHSLQWLLYVYLQQGRYSEAEGLLGVMRNTMSESKAEDRLRPNYYANNYANMAATFIVETERWDMAAKLFDTPPATADSDAKDPMMGEHAGHAQAPPTGATTRRSDSSRSLPAFVRALAASMRGATPAASSDAGATPAQNVHALEVAAASAAARNQFDEAAAFMKKACALEESMPPPSGPPSLIKPSHELYGEILLRAGRAKEAAEQFDFSLLRQPNRPRSLLGRARAAAAAGDRERARTEYSKLLMQWRQSDKAVPELKEAKEYLLR